MAGDNEVFHLDYGMKGLKLFLLSLKVNWFKETELNSKKLRRWSVGAVHLGSLSWVPFPSGFGEE